MPSLSLHSRLANLVTSFADEVLAAIRAARLEEVTGASHGARARGRGRPHGTTKRSASSSPRSATLATPKFVDGRLARRSPDEIENVLGRIVAAPKRGKTLHHTPERGGLR
jgi:hypothetical protein